ncbi:MAG: N-acetylmuramoyl-L-alanine amidase, partial [Paraglaciecola sp.]
MLSRFFSSVSNFLSSIFGGSKTPPTKPPVDAADTHLETTVQDAQEVLDETEEMVDETEVDLTPIEDGSVSEVPDEPVIPEPKIEEPTNEPPVVIVTEDPTVVIVEDPDGPATEPEVDPTPPTHKQRYLWCLDNGHGVLQAGKRSVIFDDGKTQLLEYEFNRAVVEKIMAKLDEKGVAYFDVVPDVDEVGSFLKGRVKRANNKISPLKKIFISVHANAGSTGSDGWGSATGIETWYHQNSRKGKKIAAIFQKELVDEMGWRNRHLKSSAITDLYVLRETWMPAILTENGFFTNKTQAKDLMKDSVRQKIA